MSRKDRKPEETIEIIEQILFRNGLDYQVKSEIDNCGFFIY